MGRRRYESEFMNRELAKSFFDEAKVSLNAPEQTIEITLIY
jgi:hypothetical protein